MVTCKLIAKPDRVVKKYFENHPEKLHLTAASLIIVAFEEAFPIKETPTFTQRNNNETLNEKGEINDKKGRNTE